MLAHLLMFDRVIFARGEFAPGVLACYSCMNDVLIFRFSHDVGRQRVRRLDGQLSRQQVSEHLHIECLNP